MEINGNFYINKLQNESYVRQQVDEDIDLFRNEDDSEGDGLSIFSEQFENQKILTKAEISATKETDNKSQEPTVTKKSETQIAAEKLTDKLFGDVTIPSTTDEYSCIATLSKADLNKKLNTNFNKAYASQATIEFAKSMYGIDEVKYTDAYGSTHTIETKEDIKAFQQPLPDNPQDIPVGSIVTMDNPEGGNFHNGILVGYTDDGKALVMEANSAKADGGAAIVAYDFNSNNAKSVKGYIPVDGMKNDIQSDDTINEDSATKETDNKSQEPTVTKKSETQIAAEKLTDKLFGDVTIPSTTDEYSCIATLSKADLNKKLNTNFNKAYASQATIEFAKSMYGIDEVKYTDAYGSTHTIETKEDIKAFQQPLPDNPQDIPVGSIVTMDNPEGGNFHNGILVGYTDDGKALVMEANSAKADGGAAIVAYDFNNSNSKSIKGYIPVDGFNPQSDNKIENKVESEIVVSNNEKIGAVEKTIEGPKQLYEDLGLDKQGLNYDVFSLALEGYNNLDDKGNGRLAIFDATGDKKCYIVDMKNKKFLYSTEVRLGEKGMGKSIKAANVEGSHATLSGFFKVGTHYAANTKKHFWQEGIRLNGLESGINDNALSKGVVIHYVKAKQQHTFGCMGTTPVLDSKGNVDHKASKLKNREMFPENTIVFTYPGKDREDSYRELSYFA